MTHPSPHMSMASDMARPMVTSEALYAHACNVILTFTLEAGSAKPKTINLTLKGSSWWLTTLTLSLRYPSKLQMLQVADV